MGAWCFLDHLGPASADQVDGMLVGPHPHIGLQTVTWLVAGEVVHRDSLGSERCTGYLGLGRAELRLTTAGPARALLIGGAAFSDPPHMWWNFVARDRATIETATRDWNSEAERFGEVSSPLPRPAPPPPW